MGQESTNARLRGRKPDELRQVRIRRRYTRHAEKGIRELVAMQKAALGLP